MLAEFKKIQLKLCTYPIEILYLKFNFAERTRGAQCV